jgi:hypothetical protein
MLASRIESTLNPATFRKTGPLGTRQTRHFRLWCPRFCYGIALQLPERKTLKRASRPRSRADNACQLRGLRDSARRKSDAICPSFLKLVLQPESLYICWRQLAAFQVKHQPLTAVESATHEERMPGNVNTREQSLSVQPMTKCLTVHTQTFATGSVPDHTIAGRRIKIHFAVGHPTDTRSLRNPLPSFRVKPPSPSEWRIRHFTETVLHVGNTGSKRGVQMSDELQRWIAGDLVGRLHRGQLC